VILCLGCGDHTTVSDLELRLPGLDLNIRSPVGPHKDKALLPSVDAFTAGKPQKAGAHYNHAGFLDHLPAKCIPHALVRLRPAGGEAPVLSVMADQDELGITCHAYSGSPMRAPGGGICPGYHDTIQSCSFERDHICSVPGSAAV